MNVGAEDMAKPSGIVTFLFTDIEGSTRRWEADADAMAAALEIHDQTLNEAIEGRRGWSFKHTGDGICAAFASPKAAVDAAVAAQRLLDLPVRTVIATGEAELRGSDYFGTALNLTARLMSAGHGGQILIDGTTAGLLNGVEVIDLGSRRLRDIAKPVEVFQVSARGLGNEFPPLKTLDATPGNLRRQTTSFVGRESELGDLQTVLKTHRLVTLTGVGGVGKTRLAHELAAVSSHDFADGVWVIELAAVSDAATVPAAVAAVLGITQQPGMSLAASVGAALGGRSRLLVFDNCEHVLDAAADIVEAILAVSSTVKILATSREGLRLPDEQIWPVASLEVRTSAVTLFFDRAHAVAPGNSVNDDAGAIAEICRRLDGIPLAIELAASRMQSMTAGEMRDRLDDRFRLLVGSKRGLEHHQTLRHAVQWSYDLLEVDEKSLLNRCSVFAGGFDLAGATVVAGSDDDLATLDLVDALVRKSLRVADRSSGRTRFSMLETIRRFAEEKLVAAQEADAARSAHARYFAGREAGILALWDSPRQLEAYTWFTLEFANLRAAFRWAAEQSDLDVGAAIAAYSTFLGFWVEQHEPSGWAEELIEPARLSEHRRLVQLYVMAAQCYTSGRIDDAIDYAEAAQRESSSERFDRVPYDFDLSLGGVYAANGQPERWVELARNVIARGESEHTYTRGSLALGLLLAGAVDEAIDVSEGFQSPDYSNDNPQLRCYALFVYGVARRDSDTDVAYDSLREALTIAETSGNRQTESYVAVSLSFLAFARGELGNVLDYLTVAIRHRYDAGSFRFMDSPLAVLARLLDRLELYDSAATIFGKAVTPMTRRAYPEFITAVDHLREVLGDQTYEELACAGAGMTNAAIANYALEQIDRARAQLSPTGGSQ